MNSWKSDDLYPPFVLLKGAISESDYFKKKEFKRKWLLGDLKV